MRQLFEESHSMNAMRTITMRCLLLMIAAASPFVMGAGSHVLNMGAQSVASVSEQEASSHRLGRPAILLVEPDTKAMRELIEVNTRVQVTVDATGTVRSAVADETLTSELRAKVESAALNLRYRPFKRDGQPGWVRFDETVYVLPPERKPSKHVTFPKVKNWDTVQITLSRSGCLGSCPVYRIELHGDGTVLYDGKGYVAIKGQHRASVPIENVRDLVNKFREADYYSLQDEYVSPVLDHPTYETSIEIDGKFKRVKDYIGLSVGMPFVVSELEDAIDHFTGAEQWASFDNIPDSGLNKKAAP